MIKRMAIFDWNAMKCFHIIHSPYYILLFTFPFGYAYTIHSIGLNNSLYCNYLLGNRGKAIDRKGFELLTNGCIVGIMFSR